jgi:hypothetical protein
MAEDSNWRTCYIQASKLSDAAAMRSAFESAPRGSYGIFDEHYLKTGISLKARNFKQARIDIGAIEAINIANKQEQSEHRCIAKLLTLLIDRELGLSVSEGEIIECFRESPASNWRFLFGFVNGGYLGLGFCFPQFAQLMVEQGIMDPPGLIGNHEFKEIMLSAYAYRQPFSYIRFNDGEGALLYFLERTAKLPMSFEAYLTIQQLWQGWFAEDVTALQLHDRDHLLSSFHQIVNRATVIGLDLGVTRNWHESIGLESRIGCYYASLFVRQNRLNGSVSSSSVLYELQEQHQVLEQLLWSGEPFSFLSCHPNLKDVLGNKGIAVNRNLVIPAEQKFSPLFNTEIQPGAHLTRVYHNIIQEISTVNSSEEYAWIVAAGPLGKIYAMQLAQRGCFVLDLGAIVDGLMGYPRRPRLNNLFSC